MRTETALLALLLLSPVAPLAAQGQRPSPAAQADCKFADGKTVHIDYSSPRMRGRKIFGALVPYGDVWRAGANEATTFVTTADVTVAGKPVPAGRYTLFAIPEAGRWTLIVSRKTGEWGIPYPGAADDLVRADMSVGTTPSPVENFTIRFDQADGKCTLQMEWENTRASVDLVETK